MNELPLVVLMRFHSIRPPPQRLPVQQFEPAVLDREALGCMGEVDGGGIYLQIFETFVEHKFYKSGRHLAFKVVSASSSQPRFYSVIPILSLAPAGPICF